MKTRTLRQVCETIGVSRRAVQGYEKAGLVVPTGKTSRGYLLYDEATQERIREIKQYQMLGFRVKEIGELIDAPEEVIVTALIKRLEALEQEKLRLAEAIRIVSRMIEERGIRMSLPPEEG